MGVYQIGYLVQTHSSHIWILNKIFLILNVEWLVGQINGMTGETKEGNEGIQSK